MKSSIALLALSTLSTSVGAQTGTYTWQVSNDNGATWSSSCNGTNIKVRLLASWSGVNGTNEGFAGTQFDATVLGAAPADIVHSAVIPAQFDPFGWVHLGFDIPGGKKVDMPTDAELPGMGNRWINPGQAAMDTGGPYNSTNGALVFKFDLVCSEARPIVFSMVLNSRVGRAMLIYNNSAGDRTSIGIDQITVNPAWINIPTPASLVLFCMCGLTATKRPRNEIAT